MSIIGVYSNRSASNHPAIGDPLTIPFAAASAVLSAALSLVTMQSPTPPAPGHAMPAARTGAGPWNDELVVQRVASDGKAATLATFGRANVSSIARHADGRLVLAFQGFPADDPSRFNRTAVRFSGDDGRTWSEPEPIVVAGLEPGLAPPFDPALVALPDGRMRLYFITHSGTEAAPGQTAVHSAISTDGVRYRCEPGVRFTVLGRVVVDCAAVLHGGVFHLVVPDNGTPDEFLDRRRRGEAQPGGHGYHATSTDGLAFTRTVDLTLASSRDRWFGNLSSDGGQLLFFGTGPGPWPVASADGLRWTRSPAAVEVPGVDPCAIRARDGSWIVVATRAAATAGR
jgi:hypothetical protein